MLNGEGVRTGRPNRKDIAPDDCTLALIASAITERDLGSLEPRITDSDASSATLDCKACPADLRLSGFANVVGSEACKSLFRTESSQIIRDSSAS